MFLLSLLLGLSFSQTVQHDPIESSSSNESLNFNIFVDSDEKEIDKVSLMYKNTEQIEYLSKEMISVGNNNFQCMVMDHFYNELDIDYFFIIEFTDGGVTSHPIQDFYSINIIHHQDDYWDKINNERIKICQSIMNQFPDIEASIGGQISIDIYQKGKNKAQVLNEIN